MVFSFQVLDFVFDLNKEILFKERNTEGLNCRAQHGFVQQISRADRCAPAHFVVVQDINSIDKVFANRFF